MSAWNTMIQDLTRGSRLSLAKWLEQASPGQTVLVLCGTAREKSNVQSRVNVISIRRRISVAATRLESGVLVERL